eukprot:ANDGO_00069.mRNA.1 hypothetical protein
MEFFKSLLGFKDAPVQYTYVILGIEQCPSCTAAKCLAAEVQKSVPGIRCDISTIPVSEFRQTIQNAKEILGPSAQRHRTAPFIYRVDAEKGQKMFIGGFDSFKDFVKENHHFEALQCRY